MVSRLLQYVETAYYGILKHKNKWYLYQIYSVLWKIHANPCQPNQS